MTSHRSASQSKASTRLTTVDCLRGVAAVAVVWFHLTNGNPGFNPPAWLKASGRQGWLGVEAFFVISGFVIPYALQRARYRWHDYGAFLLRRVVRLDPPYFASMVVALALTYASASLAGFRGAPPAYSIWQILSHAAYMNGLLGYVSIIPVYWSLALEFQYYLLMGVLFPLIGNRHPAIRFGTLAVLAVLALAVRNPLLVFSWFFLFQLGILAFYVREKLVSPPWYVLGVCLAGAGVWSTLGPEAAGVGLASSLLIAFAEIRISILIWLGDISYSLYLLHVPIAGRVINVAMRFDPGPTGATVAVLVAFAVALATAYGFHWLVERPARLWAERIHYGQRRPRAEVLGFNENARARVTATAS